MIRLTKSLVRRWLDMLLHVHDTPERTAAAFAIGVLIGFSPFLGLHTVMGIAVAFLFNFNRVATLLGVYSNLPWIIGQYYVFATVLGSAITGSHLPPHYREQLTTLFDEAIQSSAFWHQLARVLEPLLLPYFVGSLVGCGILAALAYPVALTIVRQHRALAAHRAKHDSRGSTQRTR
jgi:uncharacterized protein (DUF2062 family)